MARDSPRPLTFSMVISPDSVLRSQHKWFSLLMIHKTVRVIKKQIYIFAFFSWLIFLFLVFLFYSLIFKCMARHKNVSFLVIHLLALIAHKEALWNSLLRYVLFVSFSDLHCSQSLYNSSIFWCNIYCEFFSTCFHFVLTILIPCFQLL